MTIKTSWIPKPEMRIVCIEDDIEGVISPLHSRIGWWRIHWDDNEVSDYPVRDLIEAFRPVPKKEAPVTPPVTYELGQHITWHARGYIVAIHDSGAEVKFTELADTLIVPFEEVEGAQS